MKGYRTYIIAFLGFLLSGAFALEDPSDPKAWLGVVLAALMAVMRSVTTGPPAAGPGSGV